MLFVFSGFRSWDAETTGVDINDELAQIANRADLGQEGPNGKSDPSTLFSWSF